MVNQFSIFWFTNHCQIWCFLVLHNFYSHTPYIFSSLSIISFAINQSSPKLGHQTCVFFISCRIFFNFIFFKFNLKIENLLFLLLWNSSKKFNQLARAFCCCVIVTTKNLGTCFRFDVFPLKNRYQCCLCNLQVWITFNFNPIF